MTKTSDKLKEAFNKIAACDSSEGRISMREVLNEAIDEATKMEELQESLTAVVGVSVSDPNRKIKNAVILKAIENYEKGCKEFLSDPNTKKYITDQAQEEVRQTVELCKQIKEELKQ